MKRQVTEYCKNCYELQKQLKRKEQECEILTQENQEAKETIADYKYTGVLLLRKLDIAKEALEEIKYFRIDEMDGYEDEEGEEDTIVFECKQALKELDGE